MESRAVMRIPLATGWLAHTVAGDRLTWVGYRYSSDRLLRMRDAAVAGDTLILT
jgi:hypothetical protein